MFTASTGLGVVTFTGLGFAALEDGLGFAALEDGLGITALEDGLTALGLATTVLGTNELKAEAMVSVITLKALAIDSETWFCLSHSWMPLWISADLCST